MQAINKGLEMVVQELSMSENDGPVSEKFHKVLQLMLENVIYFSLSVHIHKRNILD